MITIGGSGAAPVGATLRIAETKDLDTLRRLRRAACVRGTMPERIEHLVRVPGLGRVWVMEVHATPAGYLAIGWDDTAGAAVEELMVVPAHRGHGLGAWVLGVAHAACRGRGIRELRIEVEQVLGAAAATGRCDRTVKRMRVFEPAA